MDAGDPANSTDAGRPYERLTKFFRYDPEIEPRYEVRNTLLVLSTLIATATYQAALNPPGGVWQEDFPNRAAGTSVMGAKSRASYILFIVCNSAGFFMSLTMITALTGGFPMRLELAIAMFALVCTYDVSIGAAAPDRLTSWIFYGLSVILPPLAAYVSMNLRNKLKATRFEIPVVNPATPWPPV